MRLKLLTRTLRVYIGFSIIVLLVSAPVFYWATARLFLQDAEETLFLRKEEFIVNDLPTMQISDIPVWNRISRDVKIQPHSLQLAKDSVFYQSYIDSLADEIEPYRVLITPVIIEDKPFTLLARINLVESEDMIESIAFVFCVILSVLLIGLYFITKRLSSKLWQPFYSTLSQVEKFELDKNMQPVFVETDIEEFFRLNQSINQLLEKNLQTYKNQKEFIENAAHELQTPLAVFQTKLDLLVQQMPFTHELSDALSKLNDAAVRLNRINKNLLLLSKIENSRYEAMEDVILSDLIRKHIDFLIEQAEEKGVTVHVTHNEGFTVKGNITLLEIAISNLLLNALRHNDRGGQIIIDIQSNTMAVSNTGIDHALVKEKLFLRFSSTGPSTGSGLGLSIVKRICDLHGWKLNYDFATEMHLFRIVF